MANYPENMHFTKDHEWLRLESGQGRVGISDFAQDALGDVVYVELPKVGDKFSAGESFGSVESVKTGNEPFIPASGEALVINEVPVDSPEVVNSDAYCRGWMITIKM